MEKWMSSKKFSYLLVILLLFTNTLYGTTVSASEIEDGEVTVQTLDSEDGEATVQTLDGEDGEVTIQTLDGEDGEATVQTLDSEDGENLDDTDVLNIDNGISTMSDNGIMLLSDEVNGNDLTVETYEVSISTADQLVALSEIVNDETDYDQYSNFIITITADIDLTNATGFTSIGTSEQPFYGTFDGGSKTITLNGSPLFGVVGNELNSTTISNVKLSGGAMTSTSAYVSAFIEKAANTTVSDCTNHIDVTGNTSEYVGGILGYGSSVTISNCKNYGDLSGGTNIGGIIGYAESSSITSCINDNTVNGSYAGGIVGRGASVTLKYCINRASVTGTEAIGGMIGEASSSSVIQYCLNTGKVNGGTNAGGMIGHGDGSSKTIVCVNTGTITGTNTGNTIGSTVTETTTSTGTETTTSTGNWFALDQTKLTDTYVWKDTIIIDLVEITTKDEDDTVTYELPTQDHKDILKDDGTTESIDISNYELLNITDNKLTIDNAEGTFEPGEHTYYIYLTCNNITKSQSITITVNDREFSGDDFTIIIDKVENIIETAIAEGVTYQGTDESTYIIDVNDWSLNSVWTENTDYIISYVFEPTAWQTTLTISPIITTGTGMSSEATAISYSYSVAKRTEDVTDYLYSGTSYRFPWDMEGIKNDTGESDGCTYTTGTTFYVAESDDYTYTVATE